MIAPWCVLKVKELDSRQPDGCKGPPAASAAATGSISFAEQSTTPDKARDAGAAAASDKSEPKTLTQARTREISLRLSFTTASVLIRIVSLISLLVSAAYILRDRNPIRLVLGIVLTVGGGMAGAYAAMSESWLSRAFFDGVFNAAETIALTEPGGLLALKTAAVWNLSMGFAAAGSLLAMIAIIACNDRTNAASIPGRLEALQFALVLGAALFSASSYGNAQVAEWAKGLLDSSSMAQAREVIDRVPAFWGVLGSAFLVTAGGTCYLTLNQGVAKPLGQGQPSIMKTDDGTELKFFGWLVNSVLILSPIWAALKLPPIQPF